MDAVEQQFRRMVFNVVARNQDDHVKNIAFLMDRDGGWPLAPAFDVTLRLPAAAVAGRTSTRCRSTASATTSRSPISDTSQTTASMKRGRAETILDEVTGAVGRWAEFAAVAGVDAHDISRIQAAHRLALRP